MGSHTVTDQTTSYSQVDASLGNFLSRPVLLREFDWAIGGDINVGLSPYKEFLADARVKSKIDNFSSIRGDLHIKVQISGSPFYSGRALVAGTPWNVFTQTYPDVGGRNLTLMRESQLVHGYIDPSLNEGCEFVLPFIYPYEAISLVDPLDADSMWSLSVRAMTDLRSVSEQSSPVRITIFAWMENFAFIGQTHFSSQIQMGTEAEKPGPISSVASAVSRAAGNLTKVPVIGKYAMASQIGAGAVANIAKTFGYSRPTSLEEPKRMMPFSNDNLATTNERDMSLPLALDVRNEVTIDSSAYGPPGVDNLALQTFTECESFLYKFTWNKGTSSGDILTHILNTPYHYHSTDTVMRQTPLATAANLFANWRGSIDYRFVVCSTGFHKGKLRIGYDARPHLPQPTEATTFNAGEHCVVDISKDREFCIRVGWASNKPWLSGVPVYDKANHRWFDDTTLMPALGDVYWDNMQLEANGQLTVTVMNELQSPQNTSITDGDVEILVYVKAGPDFEVARPTERFTQYAEAAYEAVTPPAKAPQQQDDASTSKTVSTPQSSHRHHHHRSKRDKRSDAHMAVEKDPTAVTMCSESVTHTFGAVRTGTDNSTKIHFGEAVTSLRPVVKRYNNVQSYSSTAPGVDVEYKVWEPVFPLPRGKALFPNGDDNHMSHLAYLGLCFVGWRGSIRTRFLATLPAEGLRWFYASNVENPSNINRSYVYNTTLTPFEIAALARDAVDDGMSGVACSNNGVLAISSPYYSNGKFQFCADYNGDFEDPRMRTGITFNWLNPQDKHVLFRMMKAAGDDFSFCWWSGTPVLRITTPQ